MIRGPFSDSRVNRRQVAIRLTAPPEMVAMFRDLKGLDERDRETIRVLMAQFKRKRGSDA